MYMPEFTLARPASLADAARLLSEPDARVLAGGTDLIPNLRRGLGAPRVLVSLESVKELGGIDLATEGLRIGAGVTVAQLAGAVELDIAYRAVREAAGAIAAPTHRAVATLGGNLCLDTRCVYYNQSEWWRHANEYCLKHRGDTCHVAPQGKLCRAAYSGDLAPALIALGARVELASAGSKSRVLPLADLYHEDGAHHLTLAPGEILVAAHVPAPAAGTRSAYLKTRVRGAIDFPLAGVAMALAVEDERISHLRVALTGTNSRPFPLEDTEALIGKTPDAAAGDALAKLVQRQASPTRTTLIAADYRRQAAAALTKRLLARLAAA